MAPASPPGPCASVAGARSREVCFAGGVVDSRRPRDVRFLLSAAGLAVALAAAVVVVVSQPEAPRVRLPSTFPAGFAVRGLDVSHHNGAIDWPRVAQSGVQFVYVKATEGADWSDPRFEANVKGARAAGLAVGAYHFFTFCRPGDEQARHFLEVAGAAATQLPPAVDVEYVGNCANPPSREVVRANLDRWLALVGGALRRRPVIYSTPDAQADFLSGLSSPLWLRRMGTPPAGPWAFWQFASDGVVPGLSGSVDLDVFQGDRAALDAL